MNNPGFLFHACGAFLFLGSCALSIGSLYLDPTAAASEVYSVIILLFAMAGVYLYAGLNVTKEHWNISLRSILFWAFACRIVFLPSLPIYETDYNRYLWDGFLVTQRINPYKYPPAIFTLSDNERKVFLNQEDIREVNNILDGIHNHEKALQTLADINNAELSTIYPPFVQILFALSSLLSPFSLMVWRFFILFFDCILILCIILLLQYFQKKPTHVIFYAWSPLILKEYINTTHFDIVALALLFMAILFGITSKKNPSTISWACGTLTKGFPLFCLPFWLQKLSWKHILFFTVILLFLTFPFLTFENRSLTGFAAFTYRWESNSSLVVFLEWIYQSMGIPKWGTGPVFFQLADVHYTLDAFLTAKITAAILFLSGLIFMYIRLKKSQEQSDEQRFQYTYMLLGLLLICSPVCNPWYIAWMVPFLCFYWSTAWLYLSVSCLLYYAFFTIEPWGYPGWIRPIEYLPFYVLLFWEWRRKNHPDRERRLL